MGNRISTRLGSACAGCHEQIKPSRGGCSPDQNSWRPKVGDLVREKGDTHGRVMRIYRLPKLRGDNAEYNVEVGRRGGILYRDVDLEPASSGDGLGIHEPRSADHVSSRQGKGA